MGRALEAAAEHGQRWVKLLELRRSSGKDLVEQRSRERSGTQRSSSVGTGEEGDCGGARKLYYDPKLAINGLGSKRRQ